MAECTENEEYLQISTVGSDVTLEHICQPCNGEGKLLEAVGFCVDCSEFLCDECYRYHLKPSLTKHHTLLDIEEAKKGKNPDICSDKCDQHGGEIIKYYCLDHDSLVCGVCISLDHRNCIDVQYIPKVAKEAGEGDELSSLLKQLDMVLLQIKIVVDTTRRNRMKSQDNFEKTLDHVKQVKMDINSVLDKMEEEIVTQAEKIKMKDMRKMDEHTKSCGSIHSLVETLTSHLKGMRQKGQYCNLFAAMKNNKKVIELLVRSLGDIVDVNPVSEYLFQPIKQLESLMKSNVSLGKLHRTGEIKTMFTKVKEICVQQNRKASLYQMFKRLDIQITGLAMLTNRILALVSVKNEYTVKLIDITHSADISEYQVACFPSSITSTEETDDIAVTLPSQCEILVLRTRDDILYKHNVIKTASSCYHVTCIKDKFVVSLAGPQRLEIIDTQGNVLQCIVKDEKGKQLFSYIMSVTVNQNTGTVYVLDSDKYAVTRLSLSGQIQGIYRDPELKSEKCATIDERGTIYVCVEGYGNIHQITPDCRKIGIVCKRFDGIDRPRSMCYDGNNDYAVTKY